MSVACTRYETVKRRFKNWGALQQFLRQSRHKHGTILKAVATIIQLEIENGNPLFQIDGYEECILPILF